MNQESKKDKPILIINKGDTVNNIMIHMGDNYIDNRSVLKTAKNYLLKSNIDYHIESMEFSDSMIYSNYSPDILSKEYLNFIFEKLIKIYNKNYFNFKRNIPINLLLNILENDNIDVFCLRIIISWSTDDQKEKLYDVLKDINAMDTYETSDGIYLFFESYDEIINNMFYIKLNINSSMICYTYEDYTLNIE